MVGRGTWRRAAQIVCCLCALAFGFVLAGAASAPRAPNPDPRPPSAPPSPPATPPAPANPTKPPVKPQAPPPPPQVPTVAEVPGGRQNPPTETTPTETTPTVETTDTTETTATTETTDTSETTGSSETLTFTAPEPPSPPPDQPRASSFTEQPARLLLLAGLILAESFVIVRLFRRDIRSLAIGIAIAAIGAGLIVYGLGA